MAKLRGDRRGSRRRSSKTSWILYLCVVAMTCLTYLVNSRTKWSKIATGDIRSMGGHKWNILSRAEEESKFTNDGIDRSTGFDRHWSNELPITTGFNEESSVVNYDTGEILEDIRDEGATGFDQSWSNVPPDATGPSRPWVDKQPDIIEGGQCEIDWNTRIVDTNFYELPSYQAQNIHGAGYLTQTKSVTQVHPNPAIKLDPDRFLMPIVEYGPNNQITGFREAAFVAIKLNRTLVIPKFFKHLTKRRGTLLGPDYISPEHRLEVKDLCSYMSCITMDQFQQACGYKVDATVVLHEMDYIKIGRVENYLGMRITEQIPLSDKQVNGIQLLPPEQMDLEERFRRRFNSSQIETLFQTNARCVIYPFPLYNLQVPHRYKRTDGKSSAVVDLVKAQEDISKYSDYSLLLSIAFHSRSPEYITKMAKDFLKYSLGREPFLSVHWRFNKDDFMKRCNHNQEASRVKDDLCENALLIKPKDLAKAIKFKVKDLSGFSGSAIRYIYIASPRSEREFVGRVAEILENAEGWKTISSLELEEYINTRYSSCDVLREHFSDIVSTTEMEICTLGLAFLGSVRSSWSVNVKIRRKTVVDSNVMTQYDGDILNLAINAKNAPRGRR